MKFHYSVLNSLLMLVLTTPSAFSKMVGSYDVKIDIDNQSGGTTKDLQAALPGWTCSSSTDARYVEALRDNHGNPKNETNSTDSNFDLFSSAPVAMKFSRELNSSNSPLGISVSETCTNQAKVCDEDANEKGEPISGRCREKVEAQKEKVVMSWDCPIGAEPSARGQNQQTQCRLTKDTFPQSPGNDILSKLRSKKFSAQITLSDKHESFAADFCKPGDANRVIVQLSQGVAGSTSQNHFIFHMNVGGHQFDIENSDGTLNEEVALCGAGQKISVSATATAKSYIYSSQYRSEQPSGGSVSLGRKVPSNWGEIHLDRQGIFGNSPANRKNTIMVVVLDPGAYQNDPALLKAIATSFSSKNLGALLQSHNFASEWISQEKTPSRIELMTLIQKDAMDSGNLR